MLTRKVKQNIRKTFLYCMVVGISLTCLAPIYLVIISSIQQDKALNTAPTFLPTHITLENYKKIFVDPYASGRIGRSILNSFLVSLPVTALCVLFSFIASYGILRANIPQKRVLLLLIIAFGTVPFFSVMIPLYVFMHNLRLLNTLTGLILIHSSFFMPLSTWICYGYLQSIPWDIEEAARIDGCTRFQALMRVVLPICLPALLTVGIFAFVYSWDDWMFSFMFSRTYDSKTLPVALAEVTSAGQHELKPWGLMCAGSIICFIPPILICFFLQKYFVAGLTRGAVKR